MKKSDEKEIPDMKKWSFVKLDMTTDGFPHWRTNSNAQLWLIQKLEIISIIFSFLAVFGVDLIVIFFPNNVANE
jgi:hypothetical protein